YRLEGIIQVVQLGGAGAGSHAGDAEARVGDATQGSLQVGQRDVDLVVFGRVGTHLNRDRAATVQKWFVVELGVVDDTQDFLLQLGDFFLQRLLVFLGVGAVGGLDGQLADTLQVVRDFGQRAFGGLRQRDAVVGVAGCLLHAADLGGH